MSAAGGKPTFHTAVTQRSGPREAQEFYPKGWSDWHLVGLSESYGSAEISAASASAFARSKS